MHFRVFPTQIPQIWEAVKYAIAQMDEIPQDHRLSDYYLWLLHQLLSEKAQCWITLNETRMLLNIVLTRISVHKITGDQQLQIIGIYAFQGLTEQAISKALPLYREFAKKMGCQTITGLSRHRRVCDLMEQCGFQREYQTYTLRVGD